MFKYNCLNPIAEVGLEKFTNEYVKTDNVNEAEGILVRSAAMHDMEFLLLHLHRLFLHIHL